MIIVRTDAQINDLMNRCAQMEDMGYSEYPGMSYEQGIKAALEWLEGADHPMDQ